MTASSPIFTLTQFIDYVKPTFVDQLSLFVMRQDKLVNKPAKAMSRHEENISAMTVGTIVDILTRATLLSTQPDTLALRDALCQVNLTAYQLGKNVALRNENALLDTLEQANWDTVIGLNAILHGLVHWRMDRRPSIKRPNRKTINNILYMVDISTQRLRQFDGLAMGRTLTAPCFPQLYPTKIDYVSSTGLWDMIVSEHEPRPIHLLKLMAYDILAFASPDYKDQEFTQVGVINPRLEHLYWLECKQFPVELHGILTRLMSHQSGTAPS